MIRHGEQSERDGRPGVVLLHSGVADHRMWEPQVASLASSYRVLAPDLRGFGQHPHQPGPFSHAEDVLELLDQVGLEEAALVGSSFGGRVALETAATAPDRVSALVLVCTASAVFRRHRTSRPSVRPRTVCWRRATCPARSS